MKHITITVTGEVQRVGYRDRVAKLARHYHITGQVRNCEGYDVEIIAEGKEEDIEKFTSAIRITEEPIHVESIEIVPGIAEGKWKYFEIQRGEPHEELGERLDAALTYLVRIDGNSRRSVQLGEKMLEKQDIMLEKQDTMIQKQDSMLEKMDTMVEKQDTMITLQKDTIHEIKDTKEDFKDVLHTKYQLIEQQLHEIQTVLRNAGMMS
ncbi:MAG: acylphosphatase [Methanospirillum sp.]|uniref:acylphosphatase n=1 Tax=Methanospirillum sp. TaxID=45200 RepID=UPI002374383F|nr:acylphosphatase [Methanospirillum sp.]MDD1729840.1 acylphosphatase [Methanospirillum sp.]